jgi:uncharacterized membrane protein
MVFHVFNGLRLKVIVPFDEISGIADHHCSNKHSRKPKGQSRVDNPEELTTLDTQDEDKQSKKHNAIYVRHK